jgi:hypothetical protein
MAFLGAVVMIEHIFWSMLTVGRASRAEEANEDGRAR